MKRRIYREILILAAALSGASAVFALGFALDSKGADFVACLLVSVAALIVCMWALGVLVREHQSFPSNSHHPKPAARIAGPTQ